MKINGIIKSENETEEQLESSVVELANKMGCGGITSKDISIAHRLPYGGDEAPTVIVKFTSRKVKESFYHGKKKLKDLPECRNVYISEDLTRLRYQVLKAAKQCGGFRSVTTSACRILVWRDGVNRPTILVHPEDLGKLDLLPDYRILGV